MCISFSFTFFVKQLVFFFVAIIMYSCTNMDHKNPSLRTLVLCIMDVPNCARGGVILRISSMIWSGFHPYLYIMLHQRLFMSSSILKPPPPPPLLPPYSSPLLLPLLLPLTLPLFLPPYSSPLTPPPYPGK